MTKFNIFKSVAFGLVALPLLSVAQPRMGSWEFEGSNGAAPQYNYYINYVGGRVVVNSPANIAGSLEHTITNDGSAGGWGGAIKDLQFPISDVDVVKAAPYEACGTLTNAAALNGKIALIQRGNCEFGAKALAAQQAGARAVIIVNNVPGPAAGMGAGAQGSGVTIPVIMVSDVDGAAIEAQLSAPVKMSFATWSNGYNNDLAILTNGVATSHAVAIPLEQVKNSTSWAYKGFTGAVIANFGTVTANEVTLRSTLSWTPTGGSTTVVRRDSVKALNFAPSDSIITPFVDAVYDLTPTTTGRYDVDYEVVANNFVDDAPGDNKARYSFYITDNIYSKGRYDFANNRPYVGRGYRLGETGTEPLTWGNFMYVDKAGYQFDKVQISLSKMNADVDNSMANIQPAQVIIYKWVDAGTPGDSIFAGSEFQVVGYGSRAFVTGDTSGQVHDIIIKDVQGTGPAITEANSFYWVATAVPPTTYLGVDGVTNHFVRSWGRSHATARVREPYSPMFADAFSNLASATNALVHYPFERYLFTEDSIRFSQQRNGLVASLPVHLSRFKVSVNDVKDNNADISLYPNPATDVVNVAINLKKEAKEVYYTVMGINGVVIKQEKHTNVRKDKYTVNTGELPAGSYMITINADGESYLRQFSIVK